MARVLVTGIGVVSSIGLNRAVFWEHCLQGRSGAVRLESPWVTETGLSTQIAAPVRGFDPIQAGIPAKNVSLLDRVVWFALGASAEALADAGLEVAAREDRA